ncbi:MAG: TlpA disulfide reductase family protein [Saprospiraceae bacterium]
MKNIYLFGIIFTFCIASSYKGQGQTMTTVNSFEELEKMYKKDSDTTYIINFWATWCQPCVKELPYFEALKESRKDTKVKVILVSLDFKNQIKSHLIPFVHKNNYTADIVIMADKNYNSWLSKVDPDWSGAIPATLLVHRSSMLFAEREFESSADLATYVSSFIHSL